MASVDPEIEFEFQSNVLPQNSFNFFEDMRKRKEYCDVILRAADLTIPAHSIVIAAAIPYLRNTLSTRGSQNEVDIPDVDDLKPSAIQSIVEFAYHGKIRSNAANVVDVLLAACRFQMDEVRDVCCSFLTENLHPENAMSVRDLACQIGCEDLVENADRYIAEKFDEMSNADDFLNCSLSVLKELLKRNDLVVKNEETVYETVIRWVTHTENRNSHLPELISNVRLALLNPSYLRLHVAKNKLIRDSPQCRDWVDEVTTYLMFPAEVVLSSEFNTQPRHYVSTDGFKSREDEGNEICHSERVLCDKTQNASALEKDIKDKSMQEQLYSCKTPDGNARKQDVGNGIEPHGQQQPPASDIQFYGVLNDTVSEDDDPGGIYAFHAKLVFSIQSFTNKTKRWQVKNKEFFTINTASVTGLTDKICFVDCENMCYYSPSDKKLSFTDSYIQGRASAAVGDTLYIFGGSDGRSVFNSAEYFDSETEEWLDLKYMSMCREYASCVALGEFLYVIGGNDLECVHDSVERYDIQNNEWDFVEPTLTGRSKLGAASLNGKIYICGGVISLVEQECAGTAEAYDPNTNQWVSILPLNTARVNFTLLPYTGKLYAVGGNDENDAYVHHVDVYNPRTGKWKLGFPMAPGLQITGAAVM